MVDGTAGTAGTAGADDTGLTGEDEGVTTLIDTGTEEVETTVLLAGQLVTSGPQLVTVNSWVE